MAQQAANESQNVTSLYGKASRERVIGQAANEIIFAVVGYVGSGTSTIAKELKKVLDEETLPGGKFDATIIKARDEIAVWAEENGYALPNPDETTAKNTGLLQDYGDDWRLKSGDNAVIAKHFALKVRSVRAKMVGVDEPGKEPVLPDGKRRAYILDSIRHPAEVALLRHIYQDAFILIGVVCQEDLRVNRLVKKYTDAGEEVAKELMKRDAKEEEKHGQRTSDAFHLSDYFVDNSMERFVNESGVEEENSKWTISDKLGRLINIVTHSEIVRPEISETAMHHAHGAQLRSACLSRQVGAALIDKRGNVLATGTNEVPRAGGGVYGEAFSSSDPDHRCAYRPDVFCSNTKEQNEIIDQIINDVSKCLELEDIPRDILFKTLRDGRVGDLIEFSRAVHAEMDALLSAARSGATLAGTRLFVTTFPCHYCARHIVSAGVDEVQYIEPYPKSEAASLHKDAIAEAVDWTNLCLPSEQQAQKILPEAQQKRVAVLFRPFSGVAPRLYRRAFLKDRELKDKSTGIFVMFEPEWGTSWHLRKMSYVQLEAELIDGE